MSSITLTRPASGRPNRIGPDSAGMRMTPEEFDAIDEYDESCRYELVDGVLVVSPLPADSHADPNELLGYLLNHYKYTHPNGSVLDKTTPERYVRVANGRRIADRVLWIGLGRRPNSRVDTPTVAVEFVSKGKRSRHRDYVLKADEYMVSGVTQYWIIDRFDRPLTVHARNGKGEVTTTVYGEHDVFEPDLLPGFEFPIARLLAEADAAAALEDPGRNP